MGIDVITIEWNGKTGTINENEAFAAAEAVERHVGVFELSRMMVDPQAIRITAVAKAYADLCKVAGVPADAVDVRKAITDTLHSAGDARTRGKNMLGEVQKVIMPLYNILTDGAPSTGDAGEGDTEGNAETPAS